MKNVMGFENSLCDGTQARTNGGADTLARRLALRGSAGGRGVVQKLAQFSSGPVESCFGVVEVQLRPCELVPESRFVVSKDGSPTPEPCGPATPWAPLPHVQEHLRAPVGTRVVPR